MASAQEKRTMLVVVDPSQASHLALERAIAGEERPIVSGGQVVGTWTHYNTALLMFLLRARRPEKFGAVRLADGTCVRGASALEVAALVRALRS